MHERPARRLRILEETPHQPRLRDAGALDNQVVVRLASHEGERDQLGQRAQQVISRRAAHAPVRELNKVLGLPHHGLLAVPLRDQLGVDVDRAHVVDDGADLQAFRVGEEVLQQRGLPCSEEAREDGHRDRLLLHRSLPITACSSFISAGSNAGRWPVPACVQGLTRHARGRSGDDEREREVK